MIGFKNFSAKDVEIVKPSPFVTPQADYINDIIHHIKSFKRGNKNENKEWKAKLNQLVDQLL